MEFVTVATVNEILLPPFLFIVIFCFLCCQLKPGKVQGVLQAEGVQKEKTTLSSPALSTSPAVENVPVEQDGGETATLTEAALSLQPELYAPFLAAIDELGKREARKVMGGLKLQQKRNGIELSTELMVACIKREFKSSPERVIEVIRERLPDLLPAYSNSIQLVS
jgi:hypothetical protein